MSDSNKNSPKVQWTDIMLGALVIAWTLISTSSLEQAQGWVYYGVKALGLIMGIELWVFITLRGATFSLCMLGVSALPVALFLGLYLAICGVVPKGSVTIWMLAVVLSALYLLMCASRLRRSITEF